MVNLSSFVGGAAGGAVVSIVIKAHDQYSSEFNKAKTSLSKFKTIATGFAIGLGTAMAAFGVSAVKAAAESERVAFRVKESFGSMADEVISASNKMQAVSVYSNDVIAQGFVDLQRRTENLGLSFQNQSAIIKGSMDLAAQTGLGFADVVDIVSSGLMGQTRGLKQLGIDLDETAKGTDVLTKLNERFASAIGAAQRETETLDGALAQLKNRYDDFKKGIGNEMIPTIKELIGALVESKGAFADVGSALAKVITYIVKGIGWVVKAVQTAGTAFGYVSAQVQAFKDLIFTGDWEAFAEKQDAIANTWNKMYNEIWNANEALTVENSTVATSTQLTGINTGTVKQNTEAVKENVSWLQQQSTAYQKYVSYSQALKGKSYGGKSSSDIASDLSTYGVSVLKGSVQLGKKGGGGQVLTAGDFISRPNQPTVSFSPDDTIIGVKNTSKLGGVTVNIGTVYGVNAQDISQALAQELKPLIAY